MKKTKTQAQIEAKKKRDRRYRERHPDKLKSLNRRSTHKYYMTHASERRQAANSASLLLKLETLDHYGNGSIKCTICGESRLNCLSIDHIEGGGNIHRNQIKIEGGGGKFYRWLRRNGYPKGYQVLCMNCQFIKYIQRLQERRRINE